MATTYQQHPHKSLQQFILDGEAELNNLEEPERTIRVQSLFAELQRRFQPSNTIEIDGYTQPPTDKDVEDELIQEEQDTLEEKEIDNGSYTHGDEGSGEPRFRSHLRVKSMDNHPTEWDHEVITHVPHVDPVVFASIHAPADLVSEGEIRVEERGYLDYKPTRPYQDRVASWMFSLQYPADSRRARSKQQLTCQRCGEPFEGRKGQKYCRPKGCDRQPMVVEEQNEWGEFGCEKAYELFLQLRLEYLLQKHGVEELNSDMTLDVAEKQRLTDLALYMVNNYEQQ
jgi:hypothetical protein